MFGWFGRKKEIELIKEEVHDSFGKVKEDIDKLGQWVGHFNNKHDSHENEFLGIKKDLSLVKKEIEELKDMISIFGNDMSKQMFKTNKQLFKKQTAVDAVQTGVQTAVQTVNFGGFSNLSVTERAIVWVLANSELKLSYEDLASMLGKTTSTIRGQINRIQHKSEGLVEMYVEKNGKKRIYMSEEIKEKILKNVKVKVREKREED